MALGGCFGCIRVTVVFKVEQTRFGDFSRPALIAGLDGLDESPITKGVDRRARSDSLELTPWG